MTNKFHTPRKNTNIPACNSLKIIPEGLPNKSEITTTTKIPPAPIQERSALRRIVDGIEKIIRQWRWARGR